MEINPAAYTDQKALNQNLVDPSRVSESALPAGFWRALVLDFLSVAAALFFGYSYFAYLTDGASPWYMVAGLTLFAVLSAMQVFLTHDIGRRLLVILAETAAMVIAFIFYDDWRVVLVAGVVVFIVLLWGYFSGWSEVGNEVEIHFFKSTAGAIGKVTTAALLFLLILYAPQAQGQGIFLPRASFRTLFDWSTGFLGSIYPGVSFNDSFGTFAQGFAKAELANNPAFAQLPAAAQDATVAQAADRLAGSIKQATGVAPTSAEPMSDVAYDYIVATLGKWETQFNGQFTIIWVVVLFLIFRTVGFIYVWAAQIVALIVYEILIAAGFMHIEGVPQTKESVTY